MGNERKVAVITGASQGIGADLVKAFRDWDYRVVAKALSFWPSTDAAVPGIPGDIADRRTTERIIFEGVKRFGRTDTLVNNAGIFSSSSEIEICSAPQIGMCSAIVSLGIGIARRSSTSPPCFCEIVQRQVKQDAMMADRDTTRTWHKVIGHLAAVCRLLWASGSA